jgi:hypothetical protein
MSASKYSCGPQASHTPGRPAGKGWRNKHTSAAATSPTHTGQIALGQRLLAQRAHMQQARHTLAQAGFGDTAGKVHMHTRKACFTTLQYRYQVNHRVGPAHQVV